MFKFSDLHQCDRDCDRNHDRNRDRNRDRTSYNFLKFYQR